MSVSPSSNRTWSGRSASASAAICVMMVYVPVPISCVPARTTARPSGSTRATADAGAWRAGYVAVAMPIPTSHRPSSIDRGFALRLLQPNRSAPAR
jgi:hypothetical protein